MKLVIEDTIDHIHPLCYAQREGVYALYQAFLGNNSDAYVCDYSAYTDEHLAAVTCDICERPVREHSPCVLLRYVSGVTPPSHIMPVGSLVEKFTASTWKGYNWCSLFGFAYQDSEFVVLLTVYMTPEKNDWRFYGRAGGDFGGVAQLPDVYEAL